MSTLSSQRTPTSTGEPVRLGALAETSPDQPGVTQEPQPVADEPLPPEVRATLDRQAIEGSGGVW
jgi:hypothetical protein